MEGLFAGFFSAKIGEFCMIKPSITGASPCLNLHGLGGRRQHWPERGCRSMNWHVSQSALLLAKDRIDGEWRRRKKNPLDSGRDFALHCQGRIMIVLISFPR